MRSQLKRRLMVAVVLASVLLVGAAQTSAPRLVTRSGVAFYLVSQYKALTGDGEGAVDALLAASEQKSSTVRALQHQATSRAAETNAVCRLQRTWKRT